MPSFVAVAQTPAVTLPVALNEATIKALQEALNKQGIAVKVDGILTDETRVAVRKYQSQHHLPVTGEPDKATLDKLGVRVGAAQAPTVAQATPTTPPAASPPSQPPTQMPQGMMMNCPMMQGQMQAMMQMMQGMMQMMQTMQGQMQSGPMQPGQMHPGSR
jgi:lysozyme family protein